MSPEEWHSQPTFFNKTKTKQNSVLVMKNWFRNSSTYSEFLEIPVPLENLWDVVADVESLPSFHPLLLSFEYVVPPTKDETKKPALAVGMRFRETAECRRGGKKHTRYKTVTRLEANDPFERYLGEGVSFQKSNGDIPNVTNTSTLTVQYMDKTTSRLLFTVSLDVPLGGVKGLLVRIFCGFCVSRTIRNAMRNELDCYCQEAVRRYEDKTKNNQA